MKKTILYVIVILICTQFCMAQWAGPINTTSDIYRQGKVELGTTTTSEQKLHLENAGATDAAIRMESTSPSASIWDTIGLSGENRFNSGHFGTVEITSWAIRFDMMQMDGSG